MTIDWQTIILAAIAAAAPTIMAWRTGKKTDQALEKVEEIHKATNSMKDALVKATRDKALDEGEAIGKAKEQEQPTTVSTPVIDGGRRQTDK